jgi:hypothetical protein
MTEKLSKYSNPCRRFKETLIKSFDELRTSGKLLIPFMVYSALVVELVKP